jgi:hypothetical protein
LLKLRCVGVLSININSGLKSARMQGKLLTLGPTDLGSQRGTCVIIDGAAGGETKRHHYVTFPLLTLHRGKDRVHFSTSFFEKENIVYTGVLPIFHTHNR